MTSFTPDDVRASYGFVGALAASVPEMAGILNTAVAQQWTADRFLMAITSTHWYRTNSSAMREWVTQQAVDPAEAAAQLGKRRVQAAEKAAALGLPIQSQLLDQVALASLLGGFDDARLGQHLARNYFDPNTVDLTRTTGQVAETQMQLKQLAGAYGMPNDEVWLRGRLGEVIRGDNTVEGAKLVAVNYAKAKYAAYADQFDAGATVVDIAAPHREAIQRTLELGEVSLQDAAVQRALQRGQAVYETEKAARQDARWQYTTNAKAAVGELATRIGKDFGYLA